MRKYTYYLSSIGRLLTGIQNWPLVVRIFLRLGPPGVKQIRLRRGGVRFRVRGAMDVWAIKETYLDRFYERFGAAIKDGWTVIDIGAGIGDFSLYAALGHPGNTVYAFEPFPESLSLLQENLRLNNATNVRAFPKAIGARTGTLALDLSSGEPLQFSTGASASPEESLVVPCLSLADAFERLGLERCDLLKLDCEGAEYEILFNAPARVTDQIERITMEYHEGVASYNRQDLVKFLSARAYEVETFPNPVHAHLGYLRAFRRCLA